MSNNSLIKEPTTLTFVTTDKCTSACNNCCFQCSPKKKLALSLEQMIDYMEQTKRDFPSVKMLVLTGGECTILKDLTEVIRIASSKYNFAIRLVSNAHWAKTYEIAKKRVKEWKNAGLNEINFSTGDEHLEFVPIESVKNAILASVDLGLVPFVNVESQESHSFSSTYFYMDKQMAPLIERKKLIIANGIWIDFKHPEKLMQRSSKVAYPVSQRCTNIFASLTITPNNRLKACCGMVSNYVKFLDLGNLERFSIRYLYNAQFEDFVKIWLHTEGALSILEFAAKYDDDIEVEKYSHMHQCLICAMIMNNDDILNIIKKHYNEVYANIILKYQMT